MHKIAEVGARLEPEACPPEGARLTMITGRPAELMIVLSHPHQLEVQAVTTAPTLFAWVDCDHAGLLAYRLGPIMPWATVAYNPHLIDPGEGTPGVDGAVRIVLVERETRTVKAVHRVRWPATFAAKVRASVTRMTGLPHERLHYEHALAALHRRYPTPEDLVIDRADAQCTATS